MASQQLVGNCVVFHIAFVGPVRSGKTTFIDKWHETQAVGSAESAAGKFQRELIMMQQQEQEQKERQNKVITSANGSNASSRRMSARISQRRRERQRLNSIQTSASRRSENDNDESPINDPFANIIPLTSEADFARKEKRNSKNRMMKSDNTTTTGGASNKGTPSNFIQREGSGSMNNFVFDDDDDEYEDDASNPSPVRSLMSTLKRRETENLIRRASSVVMFQNFEGNSYEDGDNIKEEESLNASASKFILPLSRRRSMIETLGGRKSSLLRDNQKESKNLTRRASIVMQLQAQEMMENRLSSAGSPTGERSRNNNDDDDDDDDASLEKNSFGSSKFGSWPSSEQQSHQSQRRHQPSSGAGGGGGSRTSNQGISNNNFNNNNNSRRNSSGASPFNNSTNRAGGASSPLQPESSALSSHRSSLSYTVGSSSQAQLFAQSAMIMAAREAAEQMQRVDDAIEADKQYQKLYTEQQKEKQKRRQVKDEVRRVSPSSPILNGRDKENKSNNKANNNKMKESSPMQHDLMMRRKSSVKIATIDDVEDEDLWNDDEENENEGDSGTPPNNTATVKNKKNISKRQQRDLDIVSLIRRRSGTFREDPISNKNQQQHSPNSTRKNSFAAGGDQNNNSSQFKDSPDNSSSSNPLNSNNNNNTNYTPTTYSRVVRSIATLADCASAAVHRMFLYDTPGDAERFSIPAALLSGRSISFRLNGVVVCVDGNEMKEQPQVAKQVTKLMELCERFGIAVLVIHRGAAIPDDFPRRDDARSMFISCAVDDFEQSSRAFIKFLSQLHEIELNAKKLDVRRVDIQKQQVIEHVKRPKELIPTMKRIRLEANNLNSENNTNHQKQQIQAHQHHRRPPILVALIGAAASGKSTLLSSLVDDFILSHYEPTLRLETGSCSLVGDEGPQGWRRHVVLLEGPLHDVFSRRPDVGIIFIDASSLGAIVEAAACVNEIQGLYELPRSICVVVTKQSIDDFVSLEEVSAWAGDIGAFMAGYLDTRSKKANEEFFLSLMASYLNELDVEDQKRIREIQLSLSLPEASAPAVSVSLSSLLSSPNQNHRRLQGVDEIRQTAMWINHGLHQQKMNQFEYFKMKQEEQEQFKLHREQKLGKQIITNGSNNNNNMKSIGGDGGDSNVDDDMDAKFHKGQQKITDSLIKRLRNPAAYDRIERQSKTLQFIRQACSSLPVQTNHKQNEIESGTFARSLRQSFDRRDAQATGFITKKDAEELLQPFDLANMFSVEDELRKVCVSLPSAANVHGFVNFDQFCAAVCRIAART